MKIGDKAYFISSKGKKINGEIVKFDANVMVGNGPVQKSVGPHYSIRQKDGKIWLVSAAKVRKLTVWFK